MKKITASDELLKIGYKLIDSPENIIKSTKVTAICLNCKAERKVEYRGFFRKGCKICLKNNILENTLKNYQKLLPDGYVIENFRNSVTSFSIVCSNGHRSSDFYGCQLKSFIGCRYCRRDNRIRNLYSRKGFDLLEVVNSRISKVKCHQCNHIQIKRQAKIRPCFECTKSKNYLKYKNRVNSIGWELVDFTRTDEEATLKCENGHIKRIRADNIFENSTCTSCDPGTQGYNKLNYKKVIEDKGFEYVSGDYEDSRSIIVGNCKICSFQIKKPFYRIKSCPRCSIIKRIKWNDDSKKDYLESYQPNIIVTTRDRLISEFRCKTDGYTWVTNWYSFVSEGRGCPKCAGVTPIERNKYYESFENNNYQVIDLPEKISVDTNFTAKCPVGHMFTTTYKRFNTQGQRCPVCAVGKHSSKQEIEVHNWLSSINIDFIKNDRSVIKPFEIDIFLINKNIGIELNGLYYHSDAIKSDPLVHYRKYQMAKLVGVKLIQIWEDEWKYKKDIVKSIIMSSLNLNNRKIYARETSLDTVHPIQATEFLVNNHLLGHSQSASDHIGLFYNDELVMLASYYKTKNNVYNLTRICSKLNTKIIGGFSKICSVLPRPLITWSDNRWSDGGMYAKNKWILEDKVKPAFCYVKQLKRINSQSHDVDETLPRLYDAGKKRWILE